MKLFRLKKGWSRFEDDSEVEMSNPNQSTKDADIPIVDEFEKGIIRLDPTPIRRDDLIHPNTVLVYENGLGITISFMWGGDSITISEVSKSYAFNFEKLVAYAKRNQCFIYPDFKCLKRRDATSVTKTFLLVPARNQRNSSNQ
jgi:hypothetical protein